MRAADAVSPVHRSPGDHALLRYRRLGPVSYALPVTVVRDSDVVMLWLQPGTPTRKRVMPDGSSIPRDFPYAERAALPHVVGEGTWTTNHALILVRDGDPCDIRLFWSESWEFKGWYVNLQDPVRRVPTGWDTADHVLDLWVDPGGRWAWKDEHEFAEAIRIGRFSETEAEAIRAAGRAVIPKIEAQVWPFDRSLIEWRPDPGWSMPGMPDDWNAD